MEESVPDFSDAVQPGPEGLHQITSCSRVACMRVCLRASIIVCVHALLHCYGCVIVIDPYTVIESAGVVTVNAMKDL